MVARNTPTLARSLRGGIMLELLLDLSRCVRDSLLSVTYIASVVHQLQFHEVGRACVCDVAWCDVT